MTNDILDLSSVPLFADLSSEVLEKLSDRGWEVKGQKGVPVYLSDDSANLVYVLREGRVRIYYPASGEKNITLEFLHAGDLFGELSLVDFETRGEAAETIEDSKLTVFPGNFFRSTMEDSPELFKRIFDFINRRRWKIQNRLKTLVYEDARKRVAYVLLDLTEGLGIKGVQTTTDRVELTHQELADMAGLARPTTTKILNELKDDGFIELNNQDIVLSDYLGLKEEIDLTK